MTKQIAIIDPFINTPAIQCFNGLIHSLQLSASYHLPHVTGLESIEASRQSTHAYIILGSASNIEDQLSWHNPLAQFILTELNAGKPVLGCCFGHQLICHAFGSKIRNYLENNQKITGLREIQIIQSFWNFKLGESFSLPVSHKQIVESLGPDLLCVGAGLHNDIVIHKTLPFLGTQAHPEASDAFCQENIKNLSPEDKAIAQEDGRVLIQRFMQYFDL
jgi:GMP synthase-like glutamine amidotransferase